MSTFFKLLSMFRGGRRLNAKNAVVGQELDYLLVSSLYAEQQSGYLNSYETGIHKSVIKTILEEYWQIYNRNDAIEILLSLHHRNQDEYLDIVYNAYEDSENAAAVFQSSLPTDKELYEDYVDTYNRLNMVIPELLELDLFQEFDDVKKIKNTAWNYGRGAFVARCCYDKGYLSKEELKDYLEKSYTGLKNYCTTWKEYTISYILGRAMSGFPHNDGMMGIASDLLNHEKSPLKDKIYL